MPERIMPMISINEEIVDELAGYWKVESYGDETYES